MNHEDNGRAVRPPRPADKRKPYKTPALTLFGQVAALTQNGTCNTTNDNLADVACNINTGMGMSSDRRLKTDVVRIGSHPYGFGLYLFQYVPEVQDRCGYGRRFGVMADEVEQVRPETVQMDPDGYKRVRYDLLGIRPNQH